MFYIVGPTASGKSEIAAEVAQICGGEIISADAFQIYRGLPLLTAQPDAAVLQAVPHHLIGGVPLREVMNAERFRAAALESIREIQARHRPIFVVGGSGMYVQALTDGLSPLPPANAALREWLNQFSESELLVRLQHLDAATAGWIDAQNKRRLVRALEICLMTGRPLSAQRDRPQPANPPIGVLLLRDRAELYQRIDSRVKEMFARGVVEEVGWAGEIGPTAGQTLGLSQIRDLIAGRLDEAECIASIQQATRRYAKRQLTWFQRQTNFESLNLTSHGSKAAIEWIARKARLAFTP